MLPSALWVATHQHSVNTILGEGRDRRTVRSQGDQFYNRDCWTGMLFLSFVIEGLKEKLSLDHATDEAFKKPLPTVRPEIVIAETPQRLNAQRAIALVGGSYHEALHTLHTRRVPMDRDGAAKLKAALATQPAELWVKLESHIHSTTNLVEDIRIERLGILSWPNIKKSLVPLQDLILEMESTSILERQKAQPDFKTPYSSVVLCAFRDLGLGYTSPAQENAFLRYQNDAPKAWEEVTQGKYAPLLQRAKELKEGEDVETQCLALELLSTLYEDIQDIADVTARAQLQGGDNGEDGQGKGQGKGQGSPSELSEEAADELLAAVQNLLSGTDAINEAVTQFWASEKGKGQGEKPRTSVMPPHPYSTQDDRLEIPPSKDVHLVGQWLAMCSTEIRNLRNGIIRMVRVREEVKVVHGTSRGRVSSQRLVSARLDLHAGRKPENPYYQTEMGIPISAAFAFVLDESGSMNHKTKGMGQVCAILADTLDKCNIPSLFVGVRTSGYGCQTDNSTGVTRNGAVTFDVFKSFDESWKSPQVKGRFTQIRAEGGTPLTDGVTFAMDMLHERPEAYRAIFVITDGQPDHNGSMLWCHNYLRKKNVPLIGISIVGDDLTSCLPDQISVNEVAALPAPFLTKLKELLSPRGRGLQLKIR